MSQSSGAPVYPENDSVRAIWRVGIVEFRRVAQLGQRDHTCQWFATRAVLRAYPAMSWEEAKTHVTKGVAWVTGNEHSKWFYAGRPKIRWIWPPTKEGVAHLRRVYGESEMVHASRTAEVRNQLTADQLRELEILEAVIDNVAEAI